MGPEFAPAVFLSVLTLTVGGVVLLRPLAKRLAKYLEMLIRERRELIDARPDVEALGRRLKELEERLEFSEQLTRKSAHPELPPGDPSPR
jgi:hypothetical protein